MAMESKFEHKKVEAEIYAAWEKSGAFAPSFAKATAGKAQKPFTIVLPPPNASGKMHMGNVLMIAIEDLMIRYHRMKGDPTLWIPGTDHAGFETQITYERELKKQGKSRFNYSRQTLYQDIKRFVESNKSQIENQIRQMGASVDWSRYSFTLDQHVVDAVYDTFKKMHDRKLIYRGNYLVNYCPKCGTTFADLEILHEDRVDELYYIRYPLIDRKGKEPEYIVVATTRPEPIMLDTHLAVHPKDKKNNWLVGRQLSNPLTGKSMDIIADTFVDPKFGTGVVKLTPAHDKADYEAAKKHGLPIVTGIGMDGRMTEAAGAEYKGMTVSQARVKVLEVLGSEHKNLIDHVEEKPHSVAVCYKGGHDIEPMVLPNWFVKVDDPKLSLKKPALEAVTSGKVKIFPKWREVTYTKWMEEMHDWPISRQVVWGIRIPVWYKVDGNEQRLAVNVVNEKGQFHGTIDQIISGRATPLGGSEKIPLSFEEIKQGLQQLIVPVYDDKNNPEIYIGANPPDDGRWIQETDTFDTWFSSGHWPLVTLHYPDGEDFKKFYPTSVLETGWEIIRFWVSRMIMFGIYLTGKPPFEYVYLHGLVRALDGRKMSKSLGNVINPDEYMEQYGVDALRMGLIAGTATGKDFAFPKDKIIAYRNFGNKLWNMARFYLMMAEKEGKEVAWYEPKMKSLSKEDKVVVKQLNATIKKTNELLEKFRFAEAADTIYHFMWDEVAAKYIESLKDRKDKGVALSVLRHVLLNGLKLLHPFMPFVTEAIWAEMPRQKNEMLIVSKWPEVK